MAKSIFLRFQVAEARGEIPVGSSGSLTMATLLEAGVRAAMDGYYGRDAVNKAISDARAENRALEVADQLLDDVKPVVRVLQDTHTSTDFPLALANLRQRVLRGAYQGTAATWRNWLPARNIRTTPDFKQIRDLRLTEIAEPTLRPEGSDVQYASFGESESGYTVANYERAVRYTWEMYLNDEVGAFMRAMESLGRGASRVEQVVIFQAIAAGLARSTEGAVTAGAPTIDRVKAMRNALTQRQLTDSDGNATDYGFDLTDMLAGVTNRDALLQILNQTYEGASNAAASAVPNVLAGAFTLHIERLWRRVLGNDYVGFDREADWLEVSFLEGFQGGPRFYTQMPDVVESLNQGSFSNNTLAVKISHVLGARVIDPNAAIRVQGA